jgi:CheY-like chemotaxis protein
LGLARRRLVLVVEDNKGDVFLIREAMGFAHVDADISVLHDGHEAILFFDAADKDADSRSPDLVLLDINLPRKNGYEVLKGLRQSVRCGNAKVLIVSTSDGTRDHEAFAALGVSGYFHKPSDYADFLKLGPLVKTLLDEAKTP